MTNFTPEMIEKAKTAGSPEELITLAESNGLELSAEEAAAYFAQLNPKMGELEDDELEIVSGGACGSKKKDTTPRRYGFELNVSNKVYFPTRCPQCFQTVVRNGLWCYGSIVNHGFLYWLDQAGDKWEVECKNYHKIGTYTGDPASKGIEKNEW